MASLAARLIYAQLDTSHCFVFSPSRISHHSLLPSLAPPSASSSILLPLSFRCTAAKAFPEVQRDRLLAGKQEDSLTTPFHLAIPVHNIQAARDFYGELLGCPEGRSAKTWVDFNLYGHQLVCHFIPNYNAETSANPVDSDPVPVPHFGLAMSVSDFLELAERVKARGVKFIIDPHIRFKGQPGEQWTMFFKDRSGNSLEFKAMTNPNNLFAKYTVVD